MESRGLGGSSHVTLEGLHLNVAKEGSRLFGLATGSRGLESKLCIFNLVKALTATTGTGEKPFAMYGPYPYQHVVNT